MIRFITRALAVVTVVALSICALVSLANAQQGIPNLQDKIIKSAGMMPESK